MKTFKILLAALPMLFFIACDKQDRKNDSEEENERSIAISALPQVVKDGIETKFSGAVLKEADEITKPNGDLTYDIEIVYNTAKMEVMYDARGEYLGTEVDDDDENGDDNDEEGGN